MIVLSSYYVTYCSFSQQKIKKYEAKLFEFARCILAESAYLV